MARRSFLVIFLCFAIASGAQALTQTEGSGTGCGPIDPMRPCYPTGAGAACVKATSYSTCLKKCKCEHDKNKAKCNNGAACIQVANAEKDACDTNCLIDWV